MVMNGRTAITALAVALALPVLSPARLAAGQVTVFAAASLSDAMRELARDFKKSTGDTVRLNLGASSILALQIKQGAPADVFFSADEAKMDALGRAGLIEPKTRRDLLSNSLVVVVPVDSRLPITSVEDLVKPEVKRLAIAEPHTVPAGIYAREYLQKLGLWARVIRKIVPTENVRAALAAVESGDVDAGIVYRTDALISKSVRIAYEVPRARGPPISYPIALVRGGPDPVAAARFLALVESSRGKAIFTKYGFLLQP